MNILVEDVENHKFLVSDGRWTIKPGESTNFDSTRGAYAAAKREHIGKFNIVGYFSDTEQFINIDHGSGKGRNSTALAP